MIILLLFYRASAPMSVNVFSGEPLGIFKAGEPNYGTELAMWESLKQRELTLATAQPPANYFEKMIQWTEQGKVWKFPIDNEQGSFIFSSSCVVSALNMHLPLPLGVVRDDLYISINIHWGGE